MDYHKFLLADIRKATACMEMVVQLMTRDNALGQWSDDHEARFAEYKRDYDKAVARLAALGRGEDPLTGTTDLRPAR